EPDRLAARHPCRRLRDFNAAAAIMMGIAPPSDQILVAEHPWLAMGAIADRRPRPRLAVGMAGVEPVIPFPARHCRREGRDIVRTGGPVGVSAAVIPVAPVAERHVVVDPDG